MQLLHDFLHKPEHFMHHPLRYTASIITCLSKLRSDNAFNGITHRVYKLDYGIRCETKDDTAVRGIDEVMTRLGKLIVPGLKPPVEDFPWLKLVIKPVIMFCTHSVAYLPHMYTSYLPDFVSPWKIKSRELGECMEKLYTGQSFAMLQAVSTMA